MNSQFKIVKEHLSYYEKKRQIEHEQELAADLKKIDMAHSKKIDIKLEKLIAEQKQLKEELIQWNIVLQKKITDLNRALADCQDKDLKREVLLEIESLEDSIKTVNKSSEDENKITTKPIKNIFETLSAKDVKIFKNTLNETNCQAKYNRIPLLHLVVRSCGPLHLKAMLEQKIDVNIKNEDQDPSTALQWITGLINFGKYINAWPDNYLENQGSQLLSIHQDEPIFYDQFVGLPNEIMQQISRELLSHGAILDFYSACALGDIKFIQHFLKSNPESVNVPGPDGSSALGWAARRGQIKVIELLIINGANINQKNIKTGMTPLEEAFRTHGTIQTLDFLIQNNATITPLDKENFDLSPNFLEKLDFLLTHAKNPSQLITIKIFQSVCGKVFLGDFLAILYKHNLSLDHIMGKATFKFHIYSSYSPGILRVFIALGANIFEKGDDFNKDHPRFHLANQRLQLKTWPHDRLWILEKMAILFFYGCSFEPLGPDELHPINSLNAQDLTDFLLYIYDEMENQVILRDFKNVFMKYQEYDQAQVLLKEKLNQVLLEKLNTETKIKLTKLLQRCPKLLILNHRGELIMSRSHEESKDKSELKKRSSSKNKDEIPKRLSFDELSDNLEKKLFAEMKLRKLSPQEMSRILQEDCLGKKWDDLIKVKDQEQLIQFIESQYSVKIDKNLLNTSDFVFTIAVILYVLPNISEINTQAKLFDVFIDKWLQNSIDKLISKGEGVDPDLKEYMSQYAEKLALALKNPGVCKRTEDEEAFKERLKKDPDLALILAQSQKGCPLRKTKEGYEFIHPILVEYFVTKNIFEQLSEEDSASEMTRKGYNSP